MRLDLGEIQYDSEKGSCTFPLKRYRVVSGKKLLGIGEYRRDDSPIRSSVIITNIKKAEISRSDTCAGIQEITLIFGITIKNGEISLGSAEEATGKHCFNAAFFGGDLILEIEDI